MLHPLRCHSCPLRLVRGHLEILGEQQPPQGLFVCDHAGLVINKLCRLRVWETSRHLLEKVPAGTPGHQVEEGAGMKEREFFIDNLLVRFHFIIEMIRWTGLASWESEFPFLGSLTSTFLGCEDLGFKRVPPLGTGGAGYRGTSLIRNRLLLGPYSSPVPWGLGWSWGGGAQFLADEVPQYSKAVNQQPVQEYVPHRTGLVGSPDFHSSHPQGHGRVLREQKILNRHLPRVLYYQVY